MIEQACAGGRLQFAHVERGAALGASEWSIESQVRDRLHDALSALRAVKSYIAHCDTWIEEIVNIIAIRGEIAPIPKRLSLRGY